MTRLLQVMIPIHGLSRPTAFDFSHKDNYIYFSDTEMYKIQRAKILGETVVREDFIMENLNKVQNQFSLYKKLNR